MSYLALYRKYRPSDFEDVYGQEEIVTVINNAIINNKISHAYLFSGPRGTGKTTIAKIIARLVNCDNLVGGKPCGKCYNCINFNNSNDIVEIDAASNNGVEEIRELRDKVNLVPSHAKFKVYIIDEVHMLSNSAFNALLKTLEEPPSHVIFILATTEPHKIPLTIASRCQKFRFSKISDEKIANRIKSIAKLEKINASDDVFYEIARIADGGMRDAINILDQLNAYSNGKIVLEDVYKVIGTVSYNDLSELLTNISSSNKEKIISFVDNLDKSGKEINKFIEELIVFLKDVILFKTTKVLSNIVAKNKAISLVSNLFTDKTIYGLIEMLNDSLSSIKYSSHSSIILMTCLLKFSDNDYFENKKIISREIILEKNDIEKSKTASKSNFEGENISREIINRKKMGVDEEKNIIISKVKKSDYENSNDELENSIDLIINNAFALASKDIKNEILNGWKGIDNYIYDDNYSVVSGLLKDASVVVASSSYAIVTGKNDSIVNRINENVDKVEKLFEVLFNLNLRIAAISDERWESERKKYILNTKNGIKYVVKEELNENKKKSKTPVDELIELVGDNMIEYK